MNGHMTLIPNNQDAKQEIIDYPGTPKQQKMPLMWPKQVIKPLFKFYDLSTHFIGN